MSLEKAKKAAAVLIALGLLLPQRSCVVQGKAVTFYPLSGADWEWQVILVALFDYISGGAWSAIR